MKYIKKFETEEEYNSYINGEGGGAVYLPNVSLIEEVGHCSFNPSRWNQLIQNGNFIENINGWSAYNGGNLTVSHTANTLLATARTDGTGYSWGAKCTTSPFVTEHKYYIAFSVKSSVAAKYSAEAANRGIANVSIRANIWTRINGIITASLPNSPFIIITATIPQAVGGQYMTGTTV